MQASTTARCLVLVGALMIQLILGTIYGYSIYWQPLEQATAPALTARELDALSPGRTAPVTAALITDLPAEQATEIRTARQAELRYVFSVCLLAFAITMIFAGRMQDVLGPRIPSVVGGLLLGVGYLAAAQFGRIGSYDGQLLLLLATIGLLVGVGVGFAYPCPIAALVKWFPQHKGLVSGVAVAGFGFGAFFFSRLVPPMIERAGVSTFFMSFAFVAALVVVVGAMLLRNPPPAPADRDAPSATVRETPTDVTRKQMLRTGSFYLVWLMFFSGSMAGLMVIGITKPFVKEQLERAAASSASAADIAEAAAFAVGVLAVFNAVGRIVWGLVSDRLGRTTAMAAMFVFQGLVLLVLSQLDTTVLLYAAAACIGFNFGGNFALFPSLTADLFGTKHLGANYGAVFTCYGLAGVIGVATGNAAYARTGSYFAAFAIAAALCFLSAVLAIVLARRVDGRDPNVVPAIGTAARS